MRKLFVVMLVALVAVSMVGCRLVENDDSGPDVRLAAAPATATSFTLTPTVVLPPGATTGSLKAAINPANVTMTVGSTTFVYASHTTDASGAVTVVFGSQNLATVPTTSVSATVNLGNGVTLVVSIPVNTTVNTTGNVTNTVTVTITPNAAGTGFTASVTVTNTTTNSTGSTTTQTVTTTTTTFTTEFYVMSVMFGTETLTGDAASTITINDLTPSFAVTMSSAFNALGSYTFTCVNVTDNNSQFSVNETDASVTATSAANVVTFNVVGTTAPKRLEAGKTYKVTFDSTLVSATDATKTITSVTRYFKTSTTAQ